MPEHGVGLNLDLDLGGGAASHARAGVPSFRFHAGGLRGGDALVASVRGRERVSRCYSFDVRLAVSRDVDELVLEPMLLGQPGALTIRQGAYARSFHGVVASYTVEGTRLRGDRWGLSVRLVPGFWLLRRRKNSRIFQDLRVDQIVDMVLDDHSVQRRWSLRRQPVLRNYCVQYDESDYDFVLRILAEAGISFGFEQPPALLDELLDSAPVPIEALAGAATALPGALGSAASGLLDMLPREALLFTDETSTFPAIDTLDEGGALGGVLGAAAERGASMASEALGSAGVPVSVRVAAPRLYFQDTTGTNAGEDLLRDFKLTRVTKSKSAFFRTHDPTTPTIELNAQAAVGGGLGGGGGGGGGLAGAVAGAAGGLAGGLSVGAAGISGGLSGGLSGAASALLSAVIPRSPFLKPSRLEVYEHHHDYLTVQWRSDRAEAAALLNQLRRRAWVATGASGCSRLGAARRFALDDHVRQPLNQEYLVTEVLHECEDPATAAGEGVSDAESLPPAYRNRFECVPATVAYCPKRPPRRVMQACEMATVVGPAGEEIYVNEHGCIKVQFHWDRGGSRDERSSCWLRTVQAWAGPQWGTQFIPRIGMEVLVSFEGGDPDRPIVTGTVYHQGAPTPFSLPEHKTRSGIRTQTSPGGGGYNELSFEDAKGEEQVFLHAQKNLDEEVDHDHTLVVKHDERLTVEGNQRSVVVGDRADEVHGEFTTEVRGAHMQRVQGDQDREVQGSESVNVMGGSTAVVGGAVAREAQSTVDELVHEDVRLRVRGNYVAVVGREEAPRSYALHVEGRTGLTGRVTEIEAREKLVLRCGKSVIVLGPEDIQLVAPKITLTASGNHTAIAVEEKKVTVVGDESVVLVGGGVYAGNKGGDAFVEVGSGVTAVGSSIALKSSGSGQTVDLSGQDKDPTKISLKDQDGKPLPFQPFTLISDDGAEITGVTDKDGNAEFHDLEGSWKVVFTTVGKTEEG